MIFRERGRKMCMCIFKMEKASIAYLSAIEGKEAASINTFSFFLHSLVCMHQKLFLSRTAVTSIMFHRQNVITLCSIQFYCEFRTCQYRQILHKKWHSHSKSFNASQIAFHKNAESWSSQAEFFNYLKCFIYFNVFFNYLTYLSSLHLASDISCVHTLPEPSSSLIILSSLSAIALSTAALFWDWECSCGVGGKPQCGGDVCHPASAWCL